MSRLQTIRGLVEAYVSTAFSGVTISNDPLAFTQIPKDQFPHAVSLFEEEEPERLPFKQERRRVVGSITVGILVAAGSTIKATREIMDVGIESVRDALAADKTLSSNVDDASIDAGITISSRDSEIVYGSIDVVTEEVF